MRTTIELPDDLHDLARQIAHDRREPISKVVADLMRRGIESPKEVKLVEVRRGVPIVSVGHPVTAEDVASLEDD